MIDEAVLLSKLKGVLSEAKKGSFADEILSKRDKVKKDKIKQLIKDMVDINPGGDKVVTDIIDALKKLLEESTTLTDDDINEISDVVDDLRFLDEMATYVVDESDSVEVMNIIKESEQIKNLIYEYDDRYEFSKTGVYHDSTKTPEKEGIVKRVGKHLSKIKKHVTDYSKNHPFLTAAAKYATVYTAINVAHGIKQKRKEDDIRGIYSSRFAKDAKKFLPK